MNPNESVTKTPVPIRVIVSGIAIHPLKISVNDVKVEEMLFI